MSRHLLLLAVLVGLQVWAAPDGGARPPPGAPRSSLSPRPPAGPRHLRVSAAMWRFAPDVIALKKGETVVLELVSEDRRHGFNAPDFGIRSDVEPGKVNEVTITATKAGQFPFHCDVFCGEGHEEMSGVIAVTE